MNWPFQSLRKTAALLRSAKTEFTVSEQVVTRVVASLESAPVPQVRATSTLRRLAYIGACLLLLSLVGPRVNRSWQGHRARSLLISAAEASGVPTTCHIIATMGSLDYHPHPVFSVETWVSPEGYRSDQYQPVGTLWFSSGAKDGHLWLYEPGQQSMVAAPCGDRWTSPADWANQMHSDRVVEELSHAQEVTTRHEGSMSIVTVRPVPLPGLSGSGLAQEREEFKNITSSREYLVDDDTGRLLGYRTYYEGPQGRWKASDLSIEYDLPIAQEVIAFSPPAGTHVYELDQVTEWNELVYRRPWAPGTTIP